MSRYLSFIYNPKQIKFLDRSTNVVALNHESAIVLKKKGMNFKELHEYTQHDRSIEAEATDLLNQFGLKVQGNFKNFFEEYNTHVWDLVNYFLFYDSLYCKSFPSALESLIIVKTILAKEKPDKVILISKDEFAEDVIIPALAASHVEFTMKDAKIKSAGRLKGRILSIELKRLRKIGRKISWELIHRFKKRNKPKIFLFSNRDEIIYDPKTAKISKGEIFEPIIHHLAKDSESIILDIPLDFHFGIRKMAQRNRIPIEKYLNSKAVSNARLNHKKTYAEWKVNKKKISKIFYYRNVNLNRILSKRLEFFFRHYLLDILVDLEAIKNLIKQENPNLICNFSPQGFLEQTTANYLAKKHIPSLGIQHGTITDCIDFKSKLPLPKNFKKYAYIAVFGEYYTDLLVKFNRYNKENIRITGYPKFDPLYHKTLSKERICNELNIDSKKKIVVLTTQPLHIQDEVNKTVREVASCIKEFGGIQLIIKVHPRETGYKLYKNIAAENGVKAHVIKDYDIDKILYICDVAVTAFSTTILEASILDKPSIIMDIYKKDYAHLFGNHKSILISTNKAELKENIRKVLYNKRTKDRIKELRKDFVSRYCYKVDGKSGKRVAKLIEEIIKK